MTKTIFKYYVKYWWIILLSLAFLTCEALCELQLPTYMSQIVADGIAVGDMPTVYKYGLIMLGVAFAGSVSSVSDLGSSGSFMSGNVSASAASEPELISSGEVGAGAALFSSLVLDLLSSMALTIPFVIIKIA